MKKVILLLWILAFSFSLVSCAQKSTVSMGNPSEEGASFGVDLQKEGVQLMSSELVTVEVLRDTVENYLDGIRLFNLDDAKERTYADIKNYIGTDATEYQYKEGFGQRIYTWRALDSENSYMAVTFSEVNGQWVLLSVAHRLEETN